MDRARGVGVATERGRRLSLDVECRRRDGRFFHLGADRKDGDEGIGFMRRAGALRTVAGWLDRLWGSVPRQPASGRVTFVGRRAWCIEPGGAFRTVT
jgi:hypothetical protein